MECYLTKTSAYLPGPIIGNDEIENHLGCLPGESEVKRRVLAMNGIVGRHYAQDTQLNSTHNVYELACGAVRQCLAESDAADVTFLTAGTTYSPLSAPGLASIAHGRISRGDDSFPPILRHPVEISSHAGVCCSSAAALVGAIRAVACGDHAAAIAVGAEHASEVLKATKIRPIDDRHQHASVRESQWFMAVFLRFMLSDGAGAMLVRNQPAKDQISLKVNWTHSISFAHEAPLCMQLDNQNALLTQDLAVLSKYLFPLAAKAVASALGKHSDSLSQYRVLLPHLSSFFFRRKMERMIMRLSDDPENPTAYWTNLAERGNTGAASIYVMLDEFLKTDHLEHGDRVLLFIPESGQFHFVMVSLTVVAL